MTCLPPPSERLQLWSAYFLALIMAVAVLVIFIPRPWINPTLFQTGLFLLGGVWAIALTVRPCKLRFRLPIIPLACAVAWGVLQLAAHWTTGRADTGVSVLAWLGNLLAFFLALQICVFSRVRRKFLITVVYFAFVLSVVSVVQYFRADGKIFWLFPTYDSAALGPFLNRDQYAAFIEMVLPVSLFEALGDEKLRTNSSRTVGFGVISAAMYASVIAGASRAGALLATAEIVAVPLILWIQSRPVTGHLRRLLRRIAQPVTKLVGRTPSSGVPFGSGPPAGFRGAAWACPSREERVQGDPCGPGGPPYQNRPFRGVTDQAIENRLGHANRRTAIINVWLPALVFAAVAGWALLWSRFQDPDPLQGRREMFAGTIAMIHARPWTGFGLGTFRTAYPAFAPVDFGAVVNHAHNDWAEWAADGGIPFSLLLLSVAIWSVPKGFRTVWGIGLTAVFVHGMVDFPLQKPVLELWLFALLGVVASET